MVQVTDAIGRQHQCATIQLDFNLPQRFNLEFNDADGNSRRPVIIHRAILGEQMGTNICAHERICLCVCVRMLSLFVSGSLERMIAILTEHTAGRWPFWLSPRQVTICPVSVI